VYGQVAGAFYGASAIPANWLSKLHAGDMIESFADRLANQAVK
jgi:ADP-ribosylglycohydrolase